MVYYQKIFLITALMTGLFCSSSVIAEITVEPLGFAVSIEEDGDPVEVEVTLSNSEDEDVAFTINFDEGGNVVDAEDVFSFIINLETDTSECDDIILNYCEFKYRTTKPAPETN